jgi:hypothetical protein
MTCVYTGGCHCGALRVRYEPGKAPAEVPLHICMCSFCRKHGATTASDPDARLEIAITNLSEAVRYRFEPRTADFLVCGRCGVYVAAVLSAESGAVATLNVNVLDERHLFTKIPAPVDYDDESPHQRRLRRATRWMVTSVVVPD